MSPSIVAQRSVSDQTASRRAIGVRVAQRSQSITIPISKRLTKGAVEYLRSDAVGIKALSRSAWTNRQSGASVSADTAADRLASALETLPPSCDVLRDYQREQIATIGRALMRGYRRPIAQAPTGSGKTHTMSAITAAASSASLRVLILATRTRLVRQIHERLEAFGLSHGVLAAELPGLRNLLLPVQVASADTVYRRCLGDGRTPLPAADVVIFDEAHLAAADSRMAILENYPEAVRLGLYRNACAQVRALALGDIRLSRPRPERFGADSCRPARAAADLQYADRHGRRTQSGSEGRGERLRAWCARGSHVEAQARRGRMPELAPARERQALARVRLQQGARRGIGGGIRPAWGAAELLTDKDDEATREAVFARLESGATKVVCNVFFAAYGVDLPAVECIQLARPTRSLTMYLQMVGRGMRPAPGKDHFTLIDHGRVVESLGLPTADFAWTLDERRNVNAEARESASRRSSAEQPRTCPECSHMWLVSESGNACTECGWTPAPRAKAIGVQAADLAELDTEGKGPVTPDSPAVAEFYRMACGWDMKRSGNLWKGADPVTGKSNANKRRFVAWLRARERFEFAGRDSHAGRVLESRAAGAEHRGSRLAQVQPDPLRAG